MLRIIAATVATLALSGAAQAQTEYPVRPVRIVVPSEPGGGTDTTARVLAQSLSQATGGQFVVENRPGAAQMIGIEAVARAPADGYTLLVAASPITINPAINPVRYDILRDFAPLSQLVSVPSVLVINPTLEARTLGDYVAAAKAAPGQLNYGSAGTGTQPHMSMELLKAMAGIDIQHVPYKGVAPAMTDVIAGRVSAMFLNLLSAKSQVDSGTLRALATSGAARSPVLPDVPTVGEAGLAGYESMQWFGLFAPSGTPPAVLAKLQAETAKALRSPEMKARLAADGAEGVGNSAEAFTAQIKDELTKWARVAQAAGLTPKEPAPKP